MITASMARLEAKVAAVYRRDAAAAPANHDDEELAKTLPAAVVSDDDEDDELFELDIALLDRNGGDSHAGAGGDRHRCAAASGDDGDGHALLANCLLPVSSVSGAVPVAASSVLSSYPYSGYHGGGSSRRLFAGSGRRLLGRPAGVGNSARFCFSSRGFEAMGNFQRY
ncbi:hypothetical protein ACP4OV_014559 [Aristida adscensionis]